MNKKGQIYIITAIIISVAIFSVITDVNKIYKEISVTDFRDLSRNYITEAPKVINYAIANRQINNIYDLLSGFTKEFVTYAQIRNPNMGLVYVYGDSGRTVIENYMPAEKIIEYDSSTGSGMLFSSQTKTINKVSVALAGEEFGANVPIEISNFNKKYFSSATGPASYVALDVAGVLHTFDLSDATNVPQFSVVVESATGGATEICVQNGAIITC